jgi:transposase-like protein
LIRTGARRILKEALEAEIEVFLECFKDLKTADGKQRIVPNGYLPERKIVTGIGEVEVKAPRVRDRMHSSVSDPVRFSSSILLPYLRKTKSLEELIPFLYLKGISAGDFSEALSAIVGENAQGFSQPVVSRLKSKWKEEYDRWCKRDLSKKSYVYLWVDGIHCNVRMDDKQCILVVIGATVDGRKELVAVEGGYRESAQSWKVKYCRDNQLNKHTFIYWKTKFERQQSTLPLLPVSVRADGKYLPASDQSGIVLSFNDLRIQLDADFNPNTLSRLIDLLEVRTCSDTI